MTISLSGLFIYPVKSLRGVPLQEARVADGRLVGDREWMLVSPENRFLHQRDLPQMARVHALPIAEGLGVGVAGQPDLMISPPAPDVPVEYIRGWRRLTPVRHVSKNADAWFSTALGVPARFVAFAPDTPSLETPPWEVDSSLQDATPFHITSQDSLDDFNRRAGSATPMNRFRPNLVLAGAPPYAEDDWLELQLGRIPFRWIKPCTRCAMTTTDQETGARPSPEPLRTLATYRRMGSEVCFGHYYTASADGTLRLGDEVTISATSEAP